MTYAGMDVTAVEAAANQLKNCASRLDGLSADIGREVGKLPGVWEGQDSRQFVNDWWPKHKSTLASIAQAINGLGQSAWNNAQEQRTASGQSATTTSPSHSSPAPAAPQPDSGGAPSGGGSSDSSSAGTGPGGSQDYSVSRAAELAKAEVGSSRPTGWNQEGECIKSVQRWINQAGGRFGGGGVVSGYVNSGAVQVGADQVRAGDVIQYTSTSTPDNFVNGVHTVMVVGVNSDGSYDIVQSNSPAGSGLVSEVANWRPSPPKGLEARVWRFAKSVN